VGATAREVTASLRGSAAPSSASRRSSNERISVPSLRLLPHHIARSPTYQTYPQAQRSTSSCCNCGDARPETTLQSGRFGRSKEFDRCNVRIAARDVQTSKVPGRGLAACCRCNFRPVAFPEFVRPSGPRAELKNVGGAAALVGHHGSFSGNAADGASRVGQPQPRLGAGTPYHKLFCWCEHILPSIPTSSLLGSVPKGRSQDAHDRRHDAQRFDRLDSSHAPFAKSCRVNGDAKSSGIVRSSTLCR
jgi:hypothetical protein